MAGRRVEPYSALPLEQRAEGVGHRQRRRRLLQRRHAAHQRRRALLVARRPRRLRIVEHCKQPQLEYLQYGCIVATARRLQATGACK